MSFFNSSISIWCCSLCFSRCYSIAALSMNGDWISLITILLNRNETNSSILRFSNQWNRSTSWSSFSISTWRKAFSMSPHNRIDQNLHQIRILHNRFCNATPVFRQSFKDRLVGVALTGASYIILTFVDSAFDILLVYVVWKNLSCHFL